VEIVELKDHPWFVAGQFHPEFKSRPLAPHPLFHAFVGACLARAEGGSARPPKAEPAPAAQKAKVRGKLSGRGTPRRPRPGVSG
jgi:hypothetical protein